MSSEGKRIRLTLAHQFVSHKSTDNSCWSVKSGTDRKKQAADSGRFEMLPLEIRARAKSVIPFVTRGSPKIHTSYSTLELTLGSEC